MSIRQRLLRWLQPAKRVIARSYTSAIGGRLTAGWIAPNSSADAELSLGLQKLRNRSRALIRNSPYAKRAKRIVVNNVIGNGIGLQAQVKNTRNRLLTTVNDEIEALWAEWSRADYCHTGKKLWFPDLEAAAIGEVFEAGEVIIRKHRIQQPGSPVPLALELIESERLADHFSSASSPQGNEIRMGIEVDSFGAPVAYWIQRKHPGDIRPGAGFPDELQRVPADQIIHLYLVDRWPQSRGEPWLHAVAKRLNDMEGYSEAEIVAARGAASYMAFIKTPDAETIVADQEVGTEKQLAFEPGLIQQLSPGNDIVMNNPNRPNPNMDPFMRMMLREVAAGIGVSYESLSKDYSQSNYSSSRLSLLDDRDLWRMLQGWFIRSFRKELHRIWLEAAVLAGALKSVRPDMYLGNELKFEAVRFKPRGWGWIDPTKEVEAYKEAVKAGFTTVSDVIAQSAGGQDIEDVLDQRRLELDMMAEKGLEFDTDPEMASEVEPPESPEADAAEETSQPDDSEEETPLRQVVSMRAKR